MIYLASPYSHAEERVRVRRYLYTREFVYRQLAKGVPLVSPIVYCHQFARDFDAPTDAVSWLPLNAALIEAAKGLWVLKLDGWEDSVGVKMEIEKADLLGLPITYKEPLLYAEI